MSSDTNDCRSASAPGAGATLRVVPPSAEVDLVAAERAAAQFMQALGLDTSESGLRRPRSA